jgi:translation initiation factor 1
VSERSNARIVYSSGIGEVCPGCGWPRKNCACSTRAAAQEPVGTKVVAKLRMEKKGRGGKTVSVVYDLPHNDAFLKELCQELKRACGTGGTVQGNTIELQGDLRDRIRDCLTKKGYTVKG